MSAPETIIRGPSTRSETDSSPSHPAWSRASADPGTVEPEAGSIRPDHTATDQISGPAADPYQSRVLDGPPWLDRWRTSIEEAGLTEVVDDVAVLIRQYPVQALLAGAMLGYALARWQRR
jgi:hypothetical protein